jgi:glycosyltransferase involved in cell wall biosynthesis
VPYLLEAIEHLAAEVRLTLVGGISGEMEAVLKRFRTHQHLPYVTKAELKELYRGHDVLVMPTLGDSFGFVTVEAMASGMPVPPCRMSRGASRRMIPRRFVPGCSPTTRIGNCCGMMEMWQRRSGRVFVPRITGAGQERCFRNYWPHDASAPNPPPSAASGVRHQ